MNARGLWRLLAGALFGAAIATLRDRGKPRPDMTPDERAAAEKTRDIADKAQKTQRFLRRFIRF
jgi:hypothetical protein